MSGQGLGGSHTLLQSSNNPPGIMQALITCRVQWPCAGHSGEPGPELCLHVLGRVGHREKASLSNT